MTWPVDPALFTAFFLMTTSMSMAPGPAVMVVASTGVEHSARWALITILGVLTANVVWFSLAGVGIVSLSQSGSWIFQVLRYVGAGYILWLAWKIWHNPPTAAMAREDSERPRVRKRGLYARGFILQITNPKCLVYMAVLLPPFVSPHLPAGPQIVIMAATALLMEGLCLAAYAQIGGAISPRMIKPAWAKAYSVFGAFLLAGAAVLTIMI